MRKSAKLHSKDGVGSKAIKRVNNLVCVSRHRLHLNKKTHVWVINAQPMVHIFCRDMKLDLFADGQFGGVGIPPPLTRSDIHDNRIIACVCVAIPEEK